MRKEIRWIPVQEALPPVFGMLKSDEYLVSKTYPIFIQGEKKWKCGFRIKSKREQSFKFDYWVVVDGEFKEKIKVEVTHWFNIYKIPK